MVWMGPTTVQRGTPACWHSQVKSPNAMMAGGSVSTGSQSRSGVSSRCIEVRWILVVEIVDGVEFEVNSPMLLVLW